MAKLTKEQMQRRLDKVNERLEYYYEKERDLLTKSGIASYSIGTRSVSRYQYTADIKKNIEALETERDELKNLLRGYKPRTAFAIVPQDW